MVYNLLPQDVVDSKSVKAFQTMLNSLLKKLAHDAHDWRHLCSPRVNLQTHPLVQARGRTDASTHL